ncbi:ABC transporter ATP-binding protein [Hathewaya histolytica]|uniref:Peptide ABC transporter ATP-binding protein n=1 Tax=Hathewaya histolytica TaxID=1498 RepID=A0A4U9QWS4_HATHI|nr:ABC transporter ATP-binding protein [Hathewaya histolytica]VTQ82241.1 peptide ABC transporter ATP-binding protein [Hathewaya histolytica]
MGNEVLIANNLKKIYGSRNNTYVALNGIDLSIYEGEFVGIMGPSGAGKSTLLNVLSTIDRPSSGKIIIGGSDITKLKDKEIAKFRREKLGFIFQDFNLLDTLTVKENIALPLALSKVSHNDIDKKVNEISDRLGIRDILSKYPYEISGGQKQRTAAARAIITKPSLILADEPTGALDSKSSTELLDAITELNENEKATIMMVTHDSFAVSYCKRVLFIKDGVIYSEITKNGTRKMFFQDIMDVLARIGGDGSASI